MIKVVFGKKGMGKTKILVDLANELACEPGGAVVFIDNSNQRMYDLKHEVRFINIMDFPVENGSSLLGFICGILAGNYDVSSIFIDRLTHILEQEAESLSPFFETLAGVAEKYKIDFCISITGDQSKVPEFLKQYIQ